LKNILSYNFYIFDCDGVILQSNKFKNNAFILSLSLEKKEDLEKFINYHKLNGGISRFKKFEYYFKKIKKLDNKEFKYQYFLALNKYNSIIKKSYHNCNFIPGFLKLVKYLNNNNKKNIFVVSGSEENELKLSFKKKNILKYFKNVFGSPRDKFYHNKKIIDNIEKNNNGIFFGDSKIDYLSAKENDLDFVFVKYESEWINYKEIIRKTKDKQILDFTKISYI